MLSREGHGVKCWSMDVDVKVDLSPYRSLWVLLPPLTPAVQGPVIRYGAENV